MRPTRLPGLRVQRQIHAAALGQGARCIEAQILAQERREEASQGLGIGRADEGSEGTTRDARRGRKLHVGTIPLLEEKGQPRRRQTTTLRA